MKNKAINPRDTYGTRFKHHIFIGRLATEAECDSLEGVTHIQDQQNVFYIKPLSEVPAECKPYQFADGLFRATTRSTKNTDWFRRHVTAVDPSNLLEMHRQIKPALQQKTIIFSLCPTDHNVYADIEKVFDEYPEAAYHFIPRPFRHADSVDAFLTSMKQEKEVQFRFVAKSVPFVIHDDVLFANLKWAPVPSEVDVLKVSGLEEMILIDDFDTVSEYLDFHYDNDAYFISTHNVRHLQSLIDRQKQPTLRSPADEGADVDEVVNRMPAGAPELQVVVSEKSELDILGMLEDNAFYKGLFYDAEDLYNLHTSIKTNLLTIIGGMSGIGKSQMARLYGETLGLKLGETMLMVPISPAYHEPFDILGYLNGATGHYQESETGLVSLLLRAQRHPQQLHMVIFDEMNLSQVEHWFSPFISLLELERAQRHLRLYSANQICKDAEYPSSVLIGDNLMFVGTINYDETTKLFSDRLLDRANVITPRKLSIREVNEFLQDHIPRQKFQSAPISTQLLREQWVAAKPDYRRAFTDAEIDVLDRLHDYMQAADSQKGVSYRVTQQMAGYLQNIPARNRSTPLIPRAKAFDLQLRQRILTKLSGSEMQIGDLVGSISDGVYKPGKIAELLTSAEAKTVSEFTASLALLQQKAKELMIHGYSR